MKELQDIIQAWEQAEQNGQEAILATVVEVSGSTYRRPGARMLLTHDGWQAGSVSGGCLEGDILKKAWWRTEDGKAALVVYDSTDADEDVVWGFGLGCNGVVQVLLERLTPGRPNALSFVRSCLQSQSPGLLATVFATEGSFPAQVGTHFMLSAEGQLQDGDANLAALIRDDAIASLKTGVTQCRTYRHGTGFAEVLLEVIPAPMPLVIFGSGHDAVPIVHLAQRMGWHVTVVDTRSARPRPERFPGADHVLACAPEDIGTHLTLTDRTAAVVMTHNYPDDCHLLQALLASDVPYIGQLGPKQRTERLLAEIRAAGMRVPEERMACLHGPIGLDIGADNPEEIALSVVAEIQASCAGRQGGLLRERREPLHPRVTPERLWNYPMKERATCTLSA